MNRREYDADDWRSDRLREIAADAVATFKPWGDICAACWDGILSGFRWDAVGPDYSGKPGRMGLVREEYDGEIFWSDSRFREMVTECIRFAVDLVAVQKGAE